MFSDPRSIAFITECINPQLQPTPQALQKLYTRMVGEAGLSYTNFNLMPTGAQMSTVHGRASLPNTTSHSALVFTPDRVQIKEEWPSIAMDDYVDRMKRVLEITMEELAVPSFMVTQCCIRSLVTAQGYDNAHEFFNQHFFSMTKEQVDTLGRSPNLFGLRLAFPPTTDNQSVHNVRVETFTGDPRSVYLENAAVFSKPFGTGQVNVAEEGFRAAYEFLTGNVAEYLRQVTL